MPRLSRLPKGCRLGHSTRRGTLTEGKPQMVAAQAVDGDRLAFLGLAANTRRRRPCSKPLPKNGSQLQPASQARAMPGRGITAVRLGSTRRMQEIGVAVAAFSARAIPARPGPHRLVGRRGSQAASTTGASGFRGYGQAGRCGGGAHLMPSPTIATVMPPAFSSPSAHPIHPLCAT